MTPKQEAFVREYLIDLNATQAAIRAGYSEAIGAGYYTYALLDERDGSIFYVGKGKGRRVKSHLAAIRKGRELNGGKASRVRDILNAGGNVVEFIIEDGLTETQALAFEKGLIKALEDKPITNISGGCISPAQSLLNRINNELAAIRPFNEWAALPDTQWIDAAVKLWGSKRSFYDWYVGEFEKLSNIQAVKL